MSNEINFEEVFAKYRSDPFDYIDICAAHTGRVRFMVEEGSQVNSPSGEWKHIPGTVLYEITRERNLKLITSITNGTISDINIDLEGQFVDSGAKLMTIRHPLKKKEIIENILKEVLDVFPAPERAKYFFSMDIQSRVDKKGARSVSVEPGDEVLTMSLMKRDTPVYYKGEPGVIYSVYFQAGVSVDQGTPLIGVCAPDKLHLIQKIVTRVKADWDNLDE